jgi:hypothetical protein
MCCIDQLKWQPKADIRIKCLNVNYPAEADIHNSDLVVIRRLAVPRIVISELYYY